MAVTTATGSTLRRIITGQIDLGRLTQGYFRKEMKVPEGQATGAHVQFRGVDVLQYAGQDYLGLASDERVIEAGVAAMRKYGAGALGSALMTGTLDLHLELQATLADFMGTESATIFTTGMLANVGCIPAIINSPYRFLQRGSAYRARRAIFVDGKCHESIRMATDLCKAGGVEVYKFSHLDVGDLDAHLSGNGCGSNLVITDGVFSMNGAVPRLDQMVEVAEKHSAEGRLTTIYVDSAHDVGILGRGGRGVTEMYGVEGRVVVMGVLSKAFGTLGGFVVGKQWFTHYLDHSMTHIFSLSLPPAETAAATVAIKIAAEETWRREKLLSHATMLREQLRNAGFITLGDGTQIVFVVLGNEEETERVSAELEEQRVLCPPVKFPAVDKHKAGLRLTPTVAHTDEDAGRFMEALKAVTRK